MTNKTKPIDIRIAVMQDVSIDHQNRRHCFITAWNSSSSVGRCKGVQTVLLETDLFCSAVKDGIVRLKNEDGSQAVWGQAGPVVRCQKCLDGEQIAKNGQKHSTSHQQHAGQSDYAEPSELKFVHNHN